MKIVSATLAENKKARFDYEIVETFEAWIILTWSEVKSLRNGGWNLRWSHISLASKRPVAFGIQITPYENALIQWITRKEFPLLLKKSTIVALERKTKEHWSTLIPLRLYTKGSLIKVEVALVRGKTKFDKRKTLKDRDKAREAEYAIRARAH